MLWPSNGWPNVSALNYRLITTTPDILTARRPDEAAGRFFTSMRGLLTVVTKPISHISPPEGAGKYFQTSERAGRSSASKIAFSIHRLIIALILWSFMVFRAKLCAENCIFCPVRVDFYAITAKNTYFCAVKLTKAGESY